MAEDNASLLESDGVRIAIQGCGHGHLNEIYEAVQHAAHSRGWDGVDLVIIGGDFQAVRNAADLTVMAAPIKYRKLGDFPEYYSGRAEAPFLTIFIGGNHEAISHLWELYYGGWVAPNIYYLGAANVLRFGPLRIAGMSGIWKNADLYQMPHFERLPFSHHDIKSFYHVREFDVRKLLLVREQVDIGLSHDWPKEIERWGNSYALWGMKPHFKQGSIDGTLGSPAVSTVLDHLRPAHWFAAHMHCRFSALKRHDAGAAKQPELTSSMSDKETIDLPKDCKAPEPAQRQHEATKIFNTETRFLALDKCSPGNVGRHLELCSMKSLTVGSDPEWQDLRLEYDPEWLAIIRVFHSYLTVGDRDAVPPVHEGEEFYRKRIDEERAWVERHIVGCGKLEVPENFVVTAPIHLPGDAQASTRQPGGYVNPQTTAFCDLLGLRNIWHSSARDQKTHVAR